MEENDDIMVEATVFCSYHQLDYTFVDSLEECGLITLTIQNHQKYIPHRQLATLEKIVRLHRDLNINVSGIEVILDLLDRIEDMNLELRTLRNRISLYE